jgi:hypothetical protein
MARPKKTIKNEDFKSKLAKKLKMSSETTEPSELDEVNIKPKKVKKLSKAEETELEDDIIGKSFKIIPVSFPPSTIEYDSFYNIPKENIVTKNTDLGTRVIVAKYPAFYKIYLIKYHEKGTPFYPNGGVEVYNSTFDMKQSFPLQSVAVHPTKKDKYRVTIIDE